MIRRGLVLAAAAVPISGCMDVSHVRDRVPFIYHDQTATSDPILYQRDVHRQYFDKLHRRYYYYDPVQKAYFWENGQPKG